MLTVDVERYSLGFKDDIKTATNAIVEFLKPDNDFIEISGQSLDDKFIIIAASGETVDLIKNILKDFQFDGMESDEPLND